MTDWEAGVWVLIAALSPTHWVTWGYPALSDSQISHLDSAHLPHQGIESLGERTLAVGIGHSCWGSCWHQRCPNLGLHLDPLSSSHTLS